MLIQLNDYFNKIEKLMPKKLLDANTTYVLLNYIILP